MDNEKARTDAMNDSILKIAKSEFDLETLETRKMDSLDFTEQAVWSLKNALQRAYLAGRKAGATDGICPL